MRLFRDHSDDPTVQVQQILCKEIFLNRVCQTQINESDCKNLLNYESILLQFTSIVPILTHFRWGLLHPDCLVGIYQTPLTQ